MKTEKAVILLTLSIILSLFNMKGAQAQTIYHHNNPGCDCYSEIIFEETSTNPIGVIVLDVKGANIKEYSQSNIYKNSNLFSNYNFLYMNILHLGNSNTKTCRNSVIDIMVLARRIHKSAFYFIEETDANQIVMVQSKEYENAGFNVVYNTTGDLVKLSQTINQSAIEGQYKMPEKYDYGNKEYSAKMSNYWHNFDIGLHINPIFLTGNKLGLSKGAIPSYALSFTKNISSSFALKANIGVSIKKPDIKSIQSGMQSKVMEAVQNDEETLYIDEKITGHVILGVDLSAKYYFEKTKPFRPFISAGFGSYSVLNMSGSLQDTIDISGIDMSDPSSLQDAIGGSTNTEELPDGMEQIRERYFVPQIELGLEYRLAPRAKVGISIPFRYFMNQSAGGSNTFAWGLSFGMAFTLNPGRYPGKVLRKK
jgi:hypothetical protein